MLIISNLWGGVIDLPNVSYVEETPIVYYNPYVEAPKANPRDVAGSICLWDKVKGEKVFCLQEDLTLENYPADTFTPIGVVVIPASHDVYGTIVMAHGFGRIGCFFAGCCYGVPTDSFLGVTFPGHSHAVHPTMLYEAAFLFILFGVFTFLLFKYDFKHNMSLYLVSYGIFRFLLEFIRGDHRGELLGFISPSQTWSALMVVLGVALYFLTDRFYKKKSAKKTEE